MSTVASPPCARRDQAPAAPVRHGKCGLHLSIGGTRYRLQPITPPPGFKAVWTLRKIAADQSATYQVAVEKGQQPGCTCPDHEFNGAVCKHIGALMALGLIPGRKARTAAARRSHARSVAEAPARRPVGPFAEGFNRAVAVQIRRLRGEPQPAPEPPVCAGCGESFDPDLSRDPVLCELGTLTK
jgi:SWIM zinc finger